MARARGRVVHQVADREGGTWFLKIEPRATAWEREVRAYDSWGHVPAGSMPALAASDETLSTILVSALPGLPSDGSDLDHFRQAGAWLAQFHGGEEPRPRTRSIAQAGRTLDAMHQRYPGAVGEAAYTFARSAVRMLEQQPSLEPLDMPSHGDFRPHNWVTGATSTLGVIDFGDSGWHPPTRDLAGLSYAWWQRTPGAEQAFVAGYGRPLTRSEGVAVLARNCHRALFDIYEGHRLGVRPSIRRGRRRLRALMAASSET
ncbi:phosphotransferase enzyme family protein [Nocardioides aurantiacus]|uniref:Phosphotransferase family enzyme n=1 Tax=Nocardioides aurantiacus TaxID=86796 RepID=A0A3N2CWE6_9ACTN|nr:phosphotransferase [Nocardioides aurantiacus]ROR91872.1 phosphotransferase family enzyme [Nocardioides aurantiacus]